MDPTDINVPPVRVDLVPIPGGSFWMGSAEGEPRSYPHERPRHEVTISPFWMGRVPVTQKVYCDVVQSKRSMSGEDDLPASRVSWIHALVFCNRLSELEGLEPPYRERHGQWIWDRTANGYRLPTEAEWEYAARGTDGRVYPWGNEHPKDQLCWSGRGADAESSRRTEPSPVGSFPAGASPFGLLDMAGNVWEWCWDVYGPYPEEPEQDPVGLHGGDRRIIRGGSYNLSDPSWVRTANRSWQEASNRYDDVGFRCARGALSSSRASIVGLV